VAQLLQDRDDGVIPAELAALRRERLLRSTPAGLLGMAAALRTEPDRVAELAAALRARAIPCLVVFGAADDVWPPPLQRTMASRLGAMVATIPGAAHSPNTENPQGLINTLVPIWRRWLTGAHNRSP
jgi:pimeloyl-ACP methyl ester carboxylesterase